MVGVRADSFGVVEISDTLDPSEWKQLKEFILEYAEVFQNEPWKTSLAEHYIQTDSAVPVCQRPY